jgi:hypothetical protein
VSRRNTTVPVEVRRARVARAVRVGKALGYACFGLAMVLFVVGYVVDFSAGLSAAIVTLLLVGCVALPPAIVFGYGLRAAERHDREDAARRRAAAEPGAPASTRTPPGPPSRPGPENA